jgi:hypothetical protein
MPERIILAGSVALNQFSLFAAATREVVAHPKLVPRGEVTILAAELGASASMLGAA